jgi:hypothetical protein
MDPLVLHTSATPGMNAAKIDENWEAIKDRVNGLIEAMESGGVYITSMSVDAEGKLSFGLSNATTLGPVQLPRAPIVLRGDWATATAYAAADIVSKLGGSYICVVAHESDDFDDDLTAGKWQVLAEGATARTVDYQSFSALGSAAVGGRYIGMYAVPRACELKAIDPVTLAGLSVITGTALQVKVRKITATGTVTDLGTLQIGPGAVADVEPISASFDQYDIIAFWQENSTGSTGASNLTVACVLHPLD